LNQFPVTSYSTATLQQVAMAIPDLRLLFSAAANSALNWVFRLRALL